MALKERIIDVDQFDFAVERLGVESQMAMQARVTNVRFAPDIVAKVFLHW
jgi:hypothetical protein